MSDLIRTLVIIFALFIGVPVLAYLVSKLATFGYLRARKQFEQENHQPKEGEQE